MRFKLFNIVWDFKPLLLITWGFVGVCTLSGVFVIRGDNPELGVTLVVASIAWWFITYNICNPKQ